MDDLHIPVLLREVIEYLAPAAGRIYVDANLGLGGHTQKILETSGPNGQVIGFDWDADALARAKKRLAPYEGRVRFVHRNFAEIRKSLQELGIERIDGLLLDLGLSSLQLDVSGRGFSFLKDEPLDMRMDVRRKDTAAGLINSLSEEELADLFYYYGEERQARRIAGFIVEARQRKKIETTARLAGIVAEAVPRRFHPRKIHVATRTFQALRIVVNDEIENLKTVLRDGAEFLKTGGRFCVITFHSLEDRLVKRAFAGNEILKPLTRKPVTAGEEELSRNPRSRSAKLRAAERV